MNQQYQQDLFLLKWMHDLNQQRPVDRKEQVQRRSLMALILTWIFR